MKRSVPTYASPTSSAQLGRWNAIRGAAYFLRNRTDLAELGEAMPRGNAFAELIAIKRSVQQISLEREVLKDQTEALQESLSAFTATCCIREHKISASMAIIGSSRVSSKTEGLLF
jgi:hypothetical protein